MMIFDRTNPLRVAAREKREAANAARAYSTKKPSRKESVLYALPPILLVVIGLAPSCGFFVLPALFPTLYLLYRRFAAWLPLWCVAVIGAIFSAVRFDILALFLYAFVFAAFSALLLAVRVRPYLALAATVFFAFVIGAAAGGGIIAAVKRADIPSIAAQYVEENAQSGVVGLFVRMTYDGAELPEDIRKLDKSDDGYLEEAAKYASVVTREELEEYFVYYLLHIAAVNSVVCFFAAGFINERTHSAFDEPLDITSLEKSSRALGGAARQTSIKDMKTPRSYLWACMLPAFIGSVILDLAGGYGGASSVIVHTLVTIPGAFMFFSLAFFFLSVLRGKKKIAGYIVFWLLAVAATAVPMVFFALSIIGICDCVIDIRYFTDYIIKLSGRGD